MLFAILGGLIGQFFGILGLGALLGGIFGGTLILFSSILNLVICIVGGLIGGALAPHRVPSPTISPPVAKAEIVKVKCPRCGHPNDESAKFCSRCGTSLAEVQLPPPPPAPIYYCPTCGRPLTYIPEYQRWYCYNCRKYPELV